MEIFQNLARQGFPICMIYAAVAGLKLSLVGRLRQRLKCPRLGVLPAKTRSFQSPHALTPMYDSLVSKLGDDLIVLLVPGSVR